MAYIQFQNSAGQEKDIDVVFTIATRRALTAKIGNKALAQIMMDDMTDDLAVDCFYECCRKGLDAAGISREEFEEQIDGNKLAELEAAFLEAVVNFTKPAGRDAQREILTESRKKLQAAKSALTKRALESLDTELAKILLETRPANAPVNAAENAPEIMKQ